MSVSSILAKYAQGRHCKNPTSMKKPARIAAMNSLGTTESFDTDQRRRLGDLDS